MDIGSSVITVTVNLPFGIVRADGEPFTAAERGARYASTDGRVIGALDITGLLRLLADPPADAEVKPVIRYIGDYRLLDREDVAFYARQALNRLSEAYATL